MPLEFETDKFPFVKARFFKEVDNNRGVGLATRAVPPAIIRKPFGLHSFE